MDSNEYTIQSITATGDVVVKFACDDSVQTIAGFPTEDPEALKQSLSRYLVAYKQGKALENVNVSEEVRDLVDRPQEAATDSEA